MSVNISNVCFVQFLFIVPASNNMQLRIIRIVKNSVIMKWNQHALINRFLQRNLIRYVVITYFINVSAFASMGGLLACGSDAGAWAVPHGLRTEETLLRQALGESAESVLHKGTQVILEKF